MAALRYQPGRHVVRPIPFKAHRVTGFSPESLERRYENAYGLAVRRLNDIELALADAPGDAGRAGGGSVSDGPDAQWLALKRDEIAAVNEVLLHESYFESLGEDGGEALPDGALKAAVLASFGDRERWRAEFSALAAAVAPTSGWVVLAASERQRRLVNAPASEATSAPFPSAPLIAIDMAEHAYRADFGADTRAYVDAFVDSIHWKRVALAFDRMEASRTETVADGPDDAQISVNQLRAMNDDGDDAPLVLDVRHEDDRERYRTRIMETGWRDSFGVSNWAGTLPRGKPVVVYCMYGFWVSQQVAETLRAEGIDARSLRGGIAAWRAMGYPTTPTPD